MMGNYMLPFISIFNREDGERLVFLKDNLSSIFDSIGRFMFSTSRKIDAFRKMIIPYMKYFYPVETGAGGEDFISEVVMPNRDEMDAAIDRVVKIMRGDSEINDRLSGAVTRALGIRTGVNELIGMIEEIEIYSVNAMIVSIKAETEGLSLTRIAQEMSALSRSANSIAEEYKSIIASLEESFESFARIREKIEIINENYLTQMKIKSRMIFDEMLKELGVLSVNANEIFGYSDDMKTSISDIMDAIQREDIVRQDLEKLIFLLEETGLAGNPGMGLAVKDDDTLAVILELADYKIRNVKMHMDPLIDGSEDYCMKIKKILDAFLSRFYSSTGEDLQLYDGSLFGGIFMKIEEMKNEYVRYIEEILKGKKQLYALSLSILEMLNRFSEFFSSITQITRKFETVNMLTKIEISRHGDLQKSIGVGLLGVSNLPAKMKKIIESSLSLYNSVIDGTRESVSDYSGNYRVQESILNDCIESMKKISIKLFESNKYYRNISEEIGSTCAEIIAFMESMDEDLLLAKELRRIVERSMINIRNERDLKSKGGSTGNPQRPIEVMRERYGSDDSISDYKKMMLDSLLSEYCKKNSDASGVMIF